MPQRLSLALNGEEPHVDEDPTVDDDPADGDE